MAAPCTTRRLFRRWDFETIKKLNAHCDLPPRKSKEAMVEQLVRFYGRDLTKLVAPDGPTSLEVWNEVVEEYGGARRKSFEAVRSELEAVLDPVYDDFDAETLVGDLRGSSASIRRLAQKLAVDRSELAQLLEAAHGNTQLATLVANVRRDQRRPLAPPTSSAPLVVASTTVRADNVQQLDLRWMHAFLSSASRIDVAAGFYDRDFLRLLLLDRPALQRVRLVFNGLGGRRLEAQRAELEELERDLRAVHHDVSVRLAFSPGMFHSKLFLAERDGRWRAALGSANATMAAFTRNEELLVTLDAGTEALATYFQNAWDGAKPLVDLDARPRSLVAFFRTGVMYFKPSSQLATTYNPFTELIGKLSKEEKVALGAIALPHADPGNVLGPFNLRQAILSGATSTDAPQRDDDDAASERVARAGIKPWSIETCYGYWVPAAAQPRLESKLDAAGHTKRRAWIGFRDALRAFDESLLRERYDEYLNAARTPELLGAHARHIPSLTRNPFDPRGFEGFVERVRTQLESSERIQRLSNPFTTGAVPEIWDDPDAYDDFRSTFMDYLEYVADPPGKKRPHVPGRIVAAIERETGDSFEERLESHLATHGWTDADWQIPADKDPQ